MDLPVPVITDVLGRVDRGTYSGCWHARCACHADAATYGNVDTARDAAHQYATRCPMAKRRLARWRQRQRETAS